MDLIETRFSERGESVSKKSGMGGIVRVGGTTNAKQVLCRVAEDD